MKDRKDVKDMDEKEFLERYASKEYIDDAHKRSQKSLRDEKIKELNKLIEDVEKHLTKDDPKLYPTALAELKHVKEDIDFYHGKDARLKQEDINYYNAKIKSEIKNLIEKAEYKLSKANAAEQKIYKEAIGAAKEYLKKGTEPVKPVLEKFEKVFSEDRFQKDMQDLRKKFGSEKSYEAVSAYRNLALSTKDSEYQIECLKEAKEKYAPNKDIENSIQREIDHIASNTKKYKELHKSKE